VSACGLRKRAGFGGPRRLPAEMKT
jgi:hypothetical protein